MNLNQSTIMNRTISLWSALAAVTLGLNGTSVQAQYHHSPSIIKAELIYDEAPFPQCHASTIESSGGQLVAAWFGGTHEKHPDVGIWVSRHIDGDWTVPVEVANGVQPDGVTRHPTWNPVLFQDPKSDTLVLFYKDGPSPSSWWGMRMESHDQGKTWSKPTRLPDGILGPIKNKPVMLDNGVLLCPASSEHDGWRVHMEHTRDLGISWSKTQALNDGKEFGAIQPTIFQHKDGRLQILCRSRQKVLTESWSTDGGITWSPMKASVLPNPSAGADGVTLQDGRHLLVYNHTPKGRTPINVAITRDGKNWEALAQLETDPGEYSYPAVIQAPNGKVHITYTWKRQRIKHVVMDPAQFKTKPMTNGQWPE